MRTIKRDIVGGFIFSRDGKVLLGKNRPGGVYEDEYVVPGGSIDEGETKLQALCREMLEETGIDISNNPITLINESDGRHEKTLRDTHERVVVQMHFYNYRIDLPQDAANIRVSAQDDWTQPQWFASDELEAIKTSSPTRQTLEKIGFIESH